jgi:ribose 5-phosphate isomerase RpiB
VTIAIYGDSFTVTKNRKELSWTQHLEQLGHDITNFGLNLSPKSPGYLEYMKKAGYEVSPDGKIL